MDILRLLDDLSKLIENTPSFGPITWGLNRDEISMQIAKVRASLPQELKSAVNTVRESERILETAKQDAITATETARKESERILADAKKESERTIEQGRLQQERMVHESEILKLSKAQSDEIRSAADRDSVNVRRSAEKYAYDVLTQLEGVVNKVQSAVERGKQDLQPQRDTPGGPDKRERSRV